MARYHFHIHNEGGFIEDEEGLELADLQEVRREALKGIRSMLGEQLSNGHLDLRGRLEVADAAGDAVMTIRFADTVEPGGEPWLPVPYPVSRPNSILVFGLLRARATPRAKLDTVALSRLSQTRQAVRRKRACLSRRHPQGVRRGLSRRAAGHPPRRVEGDFP